MCVYVVSLEVFFLGGHDFVQMQPSLRRTLPSTPEPLKHGRKNFFSIAGLVGRRDQAGHASFCEAVNIVRKPEEKRATREYRNISALSARTVFPCLPKEGWLLKGSVTRPSQIPKRTHRSVVCKI